MYFHCFLSAFFSLFTAAVSTNRTWHQGCYENVLENRKNNTLDITIGESQSLPRYCTYLCSERRFMYASVRFKDECHCLQDLIQLKKLNSSRCNKRCQKDPHLFCGGARAVSVYTTTVSVIFNASISSTQSASINQLLTFNASCMLSPASLPITEDQKSNSTSNSSDALSRNFISISWKVNSVVYKHVSKAVKSRAVTDNFTRRFSHLGLHIVCLNITNAWSWMSNCTSLWVIEKVHILEVIRIRGGVHVHSPEGKYGIIETESVHLDVIVNAGSFADLNFDFGDGSGTTVIKRRHREIKKNCSCFAVIKKKHTYTKKGLFSLNITAGNIFGKKELIFNHIFVVDGRITGGVIRTNVALAGSRSKVLVVPYGSFRHAAFRWELVTGEIIETSVPFVHIDFPSNSAQVNVKVVIFNAVSRVEVQGIIYTQPKIHGVVLRTQSAITTVGNVVKFEATPNISYVPWTAIANYIWVLGDGSSMYGTVPYVNYRYTKHGSFRSHVKVKNLANSAVSNYVDVHVYEMIERLTVRYKAFRFGKITEFDASVLRGSHVTFYWDFGDSTKINTTNNSVQHRYRQPGNYTFTVIAKNIVSQKQLSSKVFVTGFECQKPVVAFALGPYEENIVFSSKIRIEVEVSTNCSVSRKSSYVWKISEIVDGRKIEQNYAGIGVKQSVFERRTLIIPPFALKYGKYEFELKVQIKDTIVYSTISKHINIVSTGLNAAIKGGTVKAVGRKNHENITLDASSSYDPDFKDRSKLRFFWDCRSINDTAHGSCFKPNTTIGLNWSQPIIEFLPKILVNSANTFAFTVTVTKPGLKKVTATQFLELQNEPLYHVGVQCSECNKVDVNTHKQMRFASKCKRCGNNVSFEWRVSLVTKHKVFFRYFGKCIKPDGSTWKEAENVNHTNTTTITKLTPTRAATTVKLVSLLPVTIQKNATQDKGIGDQFQVLVCAKDLKKLTQNYTGLRFVNVSRIISGRSARKRRNLELGISDQARSDDEYALKLSKKDIFKNALEDTENPSFLFEHDDIETKMRSRRDTQQTNNSSQASQLRSLPNTTTDNPIVSTLVKSPAENGSITGLTAVGGSDSDGAVSGLGPASGGSGFFGRGYAPQNTQPRSGLGGDNLASGSGTGGGRTPSSGGSGGGCDRGSGFGNTRSSGSGSGGNNGGCSGNEDKFGEGAKNHKNKTGESSGGSGSSSSNLEIKQRDSDLKEKLVHIRQIMHPADFKQGQTSSYTSKDFSIKPNAVVPGQYYMVQLTASWQTSSGKKLAGQAKSFFTTNTGPFLGSCKVLPILGYEMATPFTLTCDHWKDQHFPLKYTVRYKATARQKHSYIYRGFKSKLNFTLPAGDLSSNYTIGLELDVEDSEGVKTVLCPIQLQVLPIADQQATIEEKIYNGTFGNDSWLQLYEDISDINSAIILASTYANSLNRLPRVAKAVSKLQLRQHIRNGLLTSIENYKVHDEELAYQHVTLIRDATQVMEEVSLHSVQLSTTLLKRLVTLKDAVTTEIMREIYDVTSNLLDVTRHLGSGGPNARSLRSSVLNILGIHDTMFRLRQLSGKYGSDVLKLESKSLSTIATFHSQLTGNTISNSKCSFVLPRVLRNSMEIISAKFSDVTSRMTVYERSPFTWGGNTIRIDSKVASLVFENSTGDEIKIFDLIEPVTVKLAINKLQATRINHSHLLQVKQMNIHDFNMTCQSKSSTLFIHVQELDAGDGNENYQLQAVLRFDKPPTKIKFNNSFTFQNKMASISFSPTPEVSKVYIGVFVKPIGREAKKKMNLPLFKYNLTVHCGRCLFWDSRRELWSGDGCQASNESSMSDLICRCNHLTSFGGHIKYLSGSLDVKSILVLHENEDVHLVLVLVLLIIAVYLLLIIYFANIERKTKSKKTVVNLPDNHPADLFRYLVISETGCSVGAGTSARVSMVIHGQEGYSQIRELTCNGENLFQRGATDCIIVSFPDSLGEIRKLKLWHDNGGASPDWFMKQITIVDCQNECSWHFSLNDWLAVGEDTKVDCELPARKTPTISILQVLCEGMLDYHIWISVFTRPFRSNFGNVQRLTCCFGTVLGYMCVISSYLQRPAMKKKEILGIWDFGWSSFYISLVATATIIPLQILFEFIFRNSGKSSCKKTVEDPSEKDPEGSGALYFLSMLSRRDSVEMSKVKQNRNTKGKTWSKANGTAEFLLPNWCNNLCMTVCMLMAIASASFTLLFGMSFDQEKMFVYVQALMLSLSFNIVVIETLLVFVMAIRRVYVLCKKIDIKTYLKIVANGESGHLQNPSFCVHKEISEKQIMAARDRARFVRFSKVLHGDKLRRAEKGAILQKDLSWLLRELILLLIYYLTLTTILADVSINDNYLQNSSVKRMITRPSTKGNSFDNISLSGDFWDWSEHKLLDILRWDCWHHLSHVFGQHTKDEDDKQHDIYTFGPARLWKEEKTHIGNQISPSRDSSNHSVLGWKILLVGKRDSMLSTLRQLRRNDWINSETKHVHVDFSYYQPESHLYRLSRLWTATKLFDKSTCIKEQEYKTFTVSFVSVIVVFLILELRLHEGINNGMLTFCYVQLRINKPEYGKFNTDVNINNVQLHFKCDAWQIWTSICKVLFVLCVLMTLQNEFCSLMDKGFRHFGNFWSLVEAFLILTTISGIAVHVWSSIIVRKALYRAQSMYLNDSELFLDLGSLVLCQKMFVLVYASLLFAVMIKNLRILCAWNRFADLVTLLQLGTSKLWSYLVAVAIVMAALSHSGKLLLASTTWYFSETQAAIMSFWSLKARKSIPLAGGSFLESSFLCRLYQVLALIAVFILWRLSVIFFLGMFASSKSDGKRRLLAVQTLSKRLRKLVKKKQWSNLLNNFKNRLWKKREEKYRLNDLPLECVFEEIEYQVEEVVFRMNNLFNMQDMPNMTDSVNDYDSDTLDSSDEAAYPSSYSTKDSISYTSESIYSEDSGYHRYGARHNRFLSDEAEDEYQGPVIHYLDEPKQRQNDTGQFLSPIFGGKYFVKTSWSTFRAPKIQPGSIECRPVPIIRPPKLQGSKTFEKLQQWSSTHSTTNTNDFAREENGLANFGFKTQENNDNSTRFVGRTRIKLPKALNSICGNFPSAEDAKFDPFQRPPKLQSITEFRTKNRKNRSFKKIQVSPFDPENCSTRSSSSSGSLPRLPSRSPSLDSGIIRSSETDEGETSETSVAGKQHVTELFEIHSKSFPDGDLSNKHCW